MKWSIGSMIFVSYDFESCFGRGTLIKIYLLKKFFSLVQLGEEKRLILKNLLVGKTALYKQSWTFLGTGFEYPRQRDLNLKKIKRLLVLSQNHTSGKKKQAIVQDCGLTLGFKPGGDAVSEHKWVYSCVGRLGHTLQSTAHRWAGFWHHWSQTWELQQVHTGPVLGSRGRVWPCFEVSTMMVDDHSTAVVRGA